MTRQQKLKVGNKPVIEAIINSIALTLFPIGLLQIERGKWIGFVSIILAVAVEWFKYYGRAQELW